MYENNLPTKKGFTLVEVMVSVSIFTILITVGIGALVTTNNTYNKTKLKRQATVAVQSAIEYMTREMRTGSLFYCGTYVGVLDKTVVRPDCWAQSTPNDAVTFVNQDGKQITFSYAVDPLTQAGYIQRMIVPALGGAATVDKLTDTRVVDIDQSTFNIQGLPVASDTLQPLVVISVAGKLVGQQQAQGQPFVIESSISPRVLDQV